MSAPEQAFRFESGAAWLDLVATLGRRFGGAPIERLGTPARLAEWLAAAGLSTRRAPTERDLVDAVELRETLHALARSAAGGEDADPAALATLNRWVGRATPELAPGAGRPRWRAPDDVGAALALLAHHAAHALADPGRAPLRACADEGCRMLYLDPGGRRRWCSSERCGTKARVRDYRRRHASERQSR